MNKFASLAPALFLLAGSAASADPILTIDGLTQGKNYRVGEEIHISVRLDGVQELMAYNLELQLIADNPLAHAGVNFGFFDVSQAPVDRYIFSADLVQNDGFTAESNPGVNPTIHVATMADIAFEPVNTSAPYNLVATLIIRSDIATSLTLSILSSEDSLILLNSDLDPISGFDNLVSGLETWRFQVIPEPSSLILLGTGLAGVLAFGMRRSFKKTDY